MTIPMQGVVRLKDHYEQRFNIHNYVCTNENRNINIALQWERYTGMRSEMKRCKRHILYREFSGMINTGL